MPRKRSRLAVISEKDQKTDSHHQSKGKHTQRPHMHTSNHHGDRFRLLVMGLCSFCTSLFILHRWHQRLVALQQGYPYQRGNATGSTTTAAKAIPLLDPSFKKHVLWDLQNQEYYLSQEYLPATPTTQAAPLTQPQTICLPWAVNGDAFWTHHPEWQAGAENATHYCFQSLVETLPQKAAFYRQLYHIQFPRDQTKCALDNLLIKRLWGVGLAAELFNFVDGLEGAMKTGRPFQIAEHQPWQYAYQKNGKAACPQRNMYCYFLNMTSCSSQNQPGDPVEFFNTKQDIEDLQGYNDKPDNNNNNNNNPNKYRWYIEYMVRPQTWLRKQVYDFVHSSQQAPKLQTPCTVMHVRRNDVILDQIQARKYHSIAEYVQAVNANINHPMYNVHNHNRDQIDDKFQEARPRPQQPFAQQQQQHTPLRPNILLLTDDQHAIGEATTHFPQYHWMYMDRPRFAGVATGNVGGQGGGDNHNIGAMMAQGWSQHLASDDPTFEMVVLLATFQMVRFCNQIVCSFGRFSEYLVEEMKRPNNYVDYFGTLPSMHQQPQQEEGDDDVVMNDPHLKRQAKVLKNPNLPPAIRAHRQEVLDRRKQALRRRQPQQGLKEGIPKGDIPLKQRLPQQAQLLSSRPRYVEKIDIDAGKPRHEVLNARNIQSQGISRQYDSSNNNIHGIQTFFVRNGDGYFPTKSSPRKEKFIPYPEFNKDINHNFGGGIGIGEGYLKAKNSPRKETFIPYPEFNNHDSNLGGGNGDAYLKAKKIQSQGMSKQYDNTQNYNANKFFGGHGDPY